MPKINYYRQQRRDGGVHSGLLLNGGNVWDTFEPGDNEDDPVLLWFIDLRADGPQLPKEAGQIGPWLLRHARNFNRGLRELARDLRAGLDFNTLPLRYEVPGAPQGVRLQIVCSAMRRGDSLQMARLLRQFAKRWQADLTALLGPTPSNAP